MAQTPAGPGQVLLLQSGDLELCGVTFGIIQLQPRPPAPKDAYSQAEGC